MEKKYKRQEMDADEVRELLYDIRDGRIKYEEVDWGDETIKEAIKDISNLKMAQAQGHNMKTYLVMNIHTHNYEIINHALGYEIKEISLPFASPRNNVENYEIIITRINGMVVKYPYSSYIIFEQIEPKDESYSN